MILTAASPVWAQAFEFDHPEELRFEADSPECVTAAIEFCYSRDIDILSPDFALDLHRFAHAYQLSVLESECEEYLGRHNKLLLFSLLFNRSSWLKMKEVKKACLEEFNSICKRPDFLQLSSKALCELLGDSRVNAKEDDVLDAALNWLAHHQADSDVVSAVLDLVRFAQLDTGTVRSKWLKSHPVIAKYPAFQTRCLQALEWIVTPQTERTEFLNAEGKQATEYLQRYHEWNGPWWSDQMMDGLLVDGKRARKRGGATNGSVWGPEWCEGVHGWTLTAKPSGLNSVMLIGVTSHDASRWGFSEIGYCVSDPAFHLGRTGGSGATTGEGTFLLIMNCSLHVLQIYRLQPEGGGRELVYEATDLVGRFRAFCRLSSVGDCVTLH